MLVPLGSFSEPALTRSLNPGVFCLAGTMRTLLHQSLRSGSQRIGRSVKRRFSTESAEAPSTPGDFCVKMVKDHDMDSYLIGLLMPQSAR